MRRTAAPVDIAALADPTRCPACGAGLTGPACGSCHVRLDGDVGRRVWALSLQLVALAGQRDAAIDALPITPVVRIPAPIDLTPYTAPSTGLPTAPSTGLPTAQPTPVANRVSVQAVLVGLGALLLAVASLVFLVRSWDVLALTARSLVVAALTAAVLGAAASGRRRVPATAQALGALGAVLLVGDAWAVRSTGLFGADGVGALRYAAVAAGVVGALLLGLHRLAPVRAWALGAAVLTPAGLLLAGADAAVRTDELALAATGPLAVALLVAAGSAPARALRVPTAERVVLLGWAAGSATAATVLAAVLVAVEQPGRAAVVLTAISLALAGLGATGRRSHPAALVRVWWAGAGAALGLAAAAGALRLHEVVGWAPDRIVPLLAAATGVVVVLLGRLPAAAAGARAVWAVALVPVGVFTAVQVAQVPAAASPTWRADLGTPLGRLTETSAALGAHHGPVVVALLLVLGTAVLDRRDWFGRSLWGGAGIRVGQALLVVAGVALLHPALPVGAVVAGLAGLAVLAGALGTVGTASGWAVGPAALLGASAVTLAWSTRPLTAAVLLLAATALLLARHRVGTSAGAALAGAATATALLAAAAVPIDFAAEQRISLAGAVGGVLLVGLVAVAAQRLSGPDRAAAALPAAAILLAAVGARIAAGSTGPDRVLEALLLLALAVTVAGALRAGRVLPGWPQVAALSAAAAPVVGAGLLVVARAELPDAVARGAAAAPSVALAVAVLGTVLGVSVPSMTLVRPTVSSAPMGRSAELGAAVVAVAALVVGLLDGPRTLWLVLLVLAAAAGALAVTGRRPGAGMLCALLLLGATWVRLGLADVRAVEAYSGPAAVLLLWLGALALRRRPGRGSWPTLGPGVAMLLGPSLVAELDGSVTWRAVALLVVATGVVLGGVGSRLQAPVVLAAAALAVHVVHLAGPTLLGWYAAQERWVTLGLAGACLLLIGARYEQRLADVRTARSLLATLR